jgi:hypothetical protein
VRRSSCRRVWSSSRDPHSRTALGRAALRGDGWLAFQRGELDPGKLADLLETLENLRGEAGRIDKPFSYVMRLHSSPRMEPRLSEFAIQVRELGFNELVINPSWEDLGEVQRLIDQVKDAVSTGGAS